MPRDNRTNGQMVIGSTQSQDLLKNEELVSEEGPSCFLLFLLFVFLHRSLISFRVAIKINHPALVSSQRILFYMNYKPNVLVNAVT